jgi:hypothetical protein
MSGRLRLVAPRFWLVAALVALVSALILGANLALLGYAQPKNDPVGQLTPARLTQIERQLSSKSGANTAVTPSPPAHDNHIPGEHSDD